MSRNHRNPPETPEAAAWELFKEILRADETEQRGRNTPARSRMLDLFSECLQAARGDRNPEVGTGLMH